MHQELNSQALEVLPDSVLSIYAVVLVLHNLACLTKISTPVLHLLSLESLSFSIQYVMEKGEFVGLVKVVVLGGIDVVVDMFREVLTQFSGEFILILETQCHVICGTCFRITSSRGITLYWWAGLTFNFFASRRTCSVTLLVLNKPFVRKIDVVRV